MVKEEAMQPVPPEKDAEIREKIVSAIDEGRVAFSPAAKFPLTLNGDPKTAPFYYISGEPFDNNMYCGYHIEWGVDGIGFGTVSLAYHKPTSQYTEETKAKVKEHWGDWESHFKETEGTWTCDTECMSMEFVARCFAELAKLPKVIKSENIDLLEDARQMLDDQEFRWNYDKFDWPVNKERIVKLMVEFAKKHGAKHGDQEGNKEEGKSEE